jgi:hypothetical protein
MFHRVARVPLYFGETCPLDSANRESRYRKVNEAGGTLFVNEFAAAP